MRIDWLWLEEYKNLKDLTIDFDQDHLITVLIGRNGTGKSNVLEALTIIFRDLLMGEDGDGKKNVPSFKYRIAYEIGDSWVFIDADPTRKEPYLAKTVSKVEHPDPYDPHVTFSYLTGKVVSRAKLLGELSEYLPKFLFGYYSGESPRMRKIFQKYTETYNKKMYSGGDDPGLTKMFYALPVHSNFVLLSFIISNETQTNNFLQEQLGLEEGGIESVLFVLKKPHWYNKNRDGGDARFWNATGLVRDFMDKLFEISLAPLRISRKDDYAIGRSRQQEYLYLYAKDLNAIRTLAEGKTTAEFFRDLESTNVSDLIDEVRIRVKLRKNDGSVTFRELSEGEQQLLTVLGLLQFTSSEESLFLLDEPDTHLNPRWSVEYIPHIRDFLKDDDGLTRNSHVLLATHNPIAVAELEKEQVQILKRDHTSHEISASAPDTHPRGMGYAGVVTSEMFGLSAALDTYTQDLLQKKRRLSALKTLAPEDEIELERLTSELESYGFRYEVRDPFLRAELIRGADRGDPEFKPVVDSSDETDMEKADRLIRKALGKKPAGQTDA